MTRVLGLLFWTWNGNIANNLGKTIVGVHIFGKLENINSQKTIQKKTCWNKGSCERKIKNTKINKSFISIILTITRWLSPLVSSHAMWGRGWVRQHICKEMNMEAMGENKACEWEDQEKEKKKRYVELFIDFVLQKNWEVFGGKKNSHVNWTNFANFLEIFTNFFTLKIWKRNLGAHRYFTNMI